LKCSIKNTALPHRGDPTRAAYKKPVVGDWPPGMRVIELPCMYNPRPAPIPVRKPKKKRKEGFLTPRRAKRSEWSEKRLDQLIELYNAGTSYVDIASKLKCSTDTAYTMISKMREAGRIDTTRVRIGWPEAHEERLIEMYTAGNSYEEIGRELGRSISSINRKVTQLKARGVLNERERRRGPKRRAEI
jgi:transposase